MSKLDETGTIIDKEITMTGRNKNDLGQILQWVYYGSRALTTIWPKPICSWLLDHII